MALQKTVTLTDNFDEDVQITDCYIKIGEIKGGKSLLIAYADYHKTSSSGSILRKKFSFVPSVADGSDNFIKQAYEHLKALSEFSDAIDV